MGRLDGRVAIVTGGAKGIGRHYSRALAAEGARVMIADVVDGTEIAEEIARENGADSVVSTVTDVSDETAVKVMVARTIERFGKIDILVNNAAMFAVLHETKCTEIEATLWDRVMAVNLRGPFLMVKHVVPRMKAQQYGKIINIGSGTAYRGVPMLLHYVTSKGGIVAFTRALSRELGEHGIRVNTLAPGFTLSDSVMQENPEHVRTAQPRAIAGSARSRVTNIRRTCSARSFFSPAPIAISSPVRTLPSTAATSIRERPTASVHRYCSGDTLEVNPAGNRYLNRLCDQCGFTTGSSQRSKTLSNTLAGPIPLAIFTSVARDLTGSRLGSAPFEKCHVFDLGAAFAVNGG